MKLNKNDIKDIIIMDEFGRIALPKNYRDKLNIEANDILVIYLIDYNTINVRTLITKESQHNL